MHPGKTLLKIRYLILVFMVALALSGITAFPVYSELKWLLDSGYISRQSRVGGWLYTVWAGVSDAEEKHPFLFYGFDWLAFAHLVIALLFIGPYRDPVRNKWVIQWAMIACVAIIPLAFIAGPIRSIPWYHILIDCSFGVIGLIPLGIILRWIRQLEVSEQATSRPSVSK